MRSLSHAVCIELTTMRRHLGIDLLLDTSLGYFGSGSVSILSIGRLPALIPANSRPSSFVEIIQQHLQSTRRVWRSL